MRYLAESTTEVCPPVRRPRLLVAAALLAGVTASCINGPPPVSDPGRPSAAPSSSRTPIASRVPTSPPTTTPAPPEPDRRCAELAASLTLSDQVGQLLLVGASTSDLTGANFAAVADIGPGGVILLGNTTAGRPAVRDLVDRLRRIGRQPKGVDLLVAVDQEGGLVQRLAGPGFEEIPSARRQAELSDRALRRAARSWGSELRAAGVDANLAPVADVVPAELAGINRPIGRLGRGYGSAPTKMAGKVAAVVEGMDSVGVATAVKHFPGLGRVRGNTDYETSVVDAELTRADPSLQTFASGIAAGADMVMTSSASYPKIDPDERAVFSAVVIEQLLRGDLGFAGVVVSDDLAAAAVRDLRPADRALQFLRAGGDLVLVGDPALVPAMARVIRQRARTDERFAASITQSVTRILEMKWRRGLAEC